MELAVYLRCEIIKLMSRGTRKILIAEDEKPMARVLSMKLKNAGFESDIFYNGEEALKALDRDTYDLILLDIVMPKIDGFDVLKLLKERKDSPPIFVLTSLSQVEDVKRAKDLGVKEYFIKSDTQLSDIVDKIKEYVNR